jgi:hypothetical protein
MGPRDLPRELAWRLRNAITLSPPAAKLSPLLNRVSSPRVPSDGAGRGAELAARYDVRPWPRICSPLDLRENLYLLDVLDRYAGGPARPCLDIGSKNWSYLPALSAWSGSSWDGVELDAHRRYLNLSTRRAHAERMAAFFPGCRYRAGSLLDMAGRYGFITWLLPFVTEGPHLAWGLPRRFFQPRALLDHAWSLLEPGGRLFVANQGREEAAVQGGLFEQAGIPARPLGEITSTLSPFRKARYGWLAEKPA